ncbi:MAG: T9SS type A sorting domain-containing protein [Bacteroidales bacterium]|nr:T9SS type A sorting domain-containing protein [Bacteroidales bacterium]
MKSKAFPILFIAFTLAAWTSLHGQTYVQVQVDQPEALDVSVTEPEYSPADTEVMVGEDLQITGGLPPYSSEWRDDTGVITTDSSFMAQLDHTADYTLTVTDSRGCYVMRTITITVVTSTNHPLGRHIRVYPIPASSFIQVNLPAELHQTRILLFDQNGRVVWQKQVTGKYRIPLSYAPGIYFLKLKNNSLETTYQIIIQ